MMVEGIPCWHLRHACVCVCACAIDACAHACLCCAGPDFMVGPFAAPPNPQPPLLLQTCLEGDWPASGRLCMGGGGQCGGLIHCISCGAPRNAGG